MIVYVVALPWDSYSVDSVRVYARAEDAHAYVNAIVTNPNSRFVEGTVTVQKCEIL
jgi:hypothetical protein